MSSSSFQERQKNDSSSSSSEVICRPREDQQQIIVPLSRHMLLQAMEKLGINAKSLESLTVEQLHDLFNRLSNLTAAAAAAPNNSSNQKERYPLHVDGGVAVLSPIDKRMLKLLLASNGDISSMTLSKELGIPLTTIQRRRKRLVEFLDISCTLALRKFDLRSITFFIAAENGMSTSIAKEILTWPSVMSVARTLSNNNIDIKADVVLKTNKEIIDFSEKIKMMPGVKELFWTESIELIGKNNDMLYSKIDSS
ncbi:Lrp/AsnC family transcriptional regulator [Candidatus Nitrososphaera evergladensis]|uniref:Lrp/AsnC family transcriptional regulator n=1 Tax=Candidatus Nitrososphaera evergladensis TaxID=1459637 RepID=UPI0011E58C0E|nr:Lrp/AsnC family transcriptional regulator [Candidatus Nitrososphaera evergladensis]